ncbi:MAG TPA: AbrB/MazE/SpoVT family DNA-binding domain-containing protein [Candidatus Saccharimonadia bacterium]|nr:AbrB/MazE/SpoVT family DNA-binding domain-containing protein [Candidatus Saccharimonadia bacterium]
MKSITSELTMLPKIYGTTTLNEKGQAVIPADARNAMGLTAGSKLLVMGHPNGKGLFLITTEQAEHMLKHFADLSTAIKESRSTGE